MIKMNKALTRINKMTIMATNVEFLTYFSGFVVVLDRWVVILVVLSVVMVVMLVSAVVVELSKDVVVVVFGAADDEAVDSVVEVEVEDAVDVVLLSELVVVFSDCEVVGLTVELTAVVVSLSENSSAIGFTL